MTTSTNIAEAAAFIREFDPALSNMFLNQPFRRCQIAEAFFGGFAKQSEYSFLVCRFVENVARLDAMGRRQDAA